VGLFGGTFSAVEQCGGSGVGDVSGSADRADDDVQGLMERRARFLYGGACLAVERSGGLDIDDEVTAVVTGRGRGAQHLRGLVGQAAKEVAAGRLGGGEDFLVGGVEGPGIAAQRSV